MKRLRALPDRLRAYADPAAIFVALALSLAFTYSAWDAARTGADRGARERFASEVQRVTEAVRGHVLDHEQVLRGATGLFRASVSVERDEWRDYTRTLRLDKTHPGIQGIGYAHRVPAAEGGAHVHRLRNEGFPNYVIHPAGERAEYFPVVYVEPFSGRNTKVLGYDMFSEPVRRAAMELARDGGEVALSGKVLLQDADADAQAGYLMYAPVYRNGLATENVEQRRRALVGYVYASLRANNLIRDTLGGTLDIRVQFFDGETTGSHNLLYDSLAALLQKPPSTAPAFSVTVPIRMHGRTWTLHAVSLPEFEAQTDYARPRIVLVLGIVGSGMLAAMLWLLASTRARAVSLAQSMTRELRESAQALRDSRERLALAMEGSNLAFFDWNVVTGRIELSERWGLMLGGAPEPTVTTIDEFESLVHADERGALRKALHALLEGSAPFYEVEHRVRMRDGGWKWIESHAKVTERDPHGKALRVTGTNSDITERKEIERIRREFVATVSHELRTPLTAVIGALGLLKEEAAGRLPAEASNFLTMAEENSERLAALVNDILDLEKIESGRMELQLAPLKIRPFLKRAVQVNEMVAAKYGVAFRLQEPIPDASVVADEQRLLQVVTNLLSNAAKFSPAGVAVTVSAAIHDAGVRIDVADRGPGIPEEFRSRIYNKFVQADSSDTRRKGGTGLGLAISKAILERMSGRISFDTAVGQGTTFHVDLPLAR